MGIELFRSDPYRSDFSALVTSVEEDWAVLDRTCFCPDLQQLSIQDRGWLGGEPVVAVERRGKEIYHRVQLGNGGHALVIGDQVLGTLNWERRYRNMRLHTAQHLVDLAVRATHGTAGVSMTSGIDGRMGVAVSISGLTLDLAVVAAWVDSVVADDLPILISTDDGSAEALWHLDGLGHGRCAAPHVGSTGEIGPIKLVSESRGRRLGLAIQVLN